MVGNGWYFRDGQVDYKSRWVRNERFVLQEKARRSLFGRYRNRYTNDPSVQGKDQSTANTSAVSQSVNPCRLTGTIPR